MAATTQNDEDILIIDESSSDTDSPIEFSFDSEETSEVSSDTQNSEEKSSDLDIENDSLVSIPDITHAENETKEDATDSKKLGVKDFFDSSIPNSKEEGEALSEESKSDTEEVVVNDVFEVTTDDKEEISETSDDTSEGNDLFGSVETEELHTDESTEEVDGDVVFDFGGDGENSQENSVNLDVTSENMDAILSHTIATLEKRKEHIVGAKKTKQDEEGEIKKQIADLEAKHAELVSEVELLDTESDTITKNISELENMKLISKK